MKNFKKFLKWAITERTASVVVLPVCVAILSFIIFKTAYKTGYVDGIIEANQVSYKRGYSDGLFDRARLDSIHKENDTVSSDSIHLQILKEFDKMIREGHKKRNIHNKKNPSMINKDCKLKNKVAFYLRNEGWADTINEDGEFEYNEDRDDENFVCNRVEKDGDKYIVYATHIEDFYGYDEEFPEDGGSYEVALTQKQYDDLCKGHHTCLEEKGLQFPTYLTILSSTPKELFEYYLNEYD